MKTVSSFADPTKPLAETTMVFAHNAYNSAAYGAMWPNQTLSITELLDMGVRGLELDVYFDKGELRLCHMVCADYGLGLSLKMEDALKEVSAWMNKNPGNVVFLKIEDQLEENGKKLLSTMVKDVFDKGKIFTPENLAQNFNNQWPSLNAISEAGKNLVVMPQGDMHDSLMFAGGWGGQFRQPAVSGNIARVQDLGFQVAKTNSSQLSEVIEDRSALGTIGDLKHNFGGEPAADGRMSINDIEELRKNGVNIISADLLQANDPRFNNPALLPRLLDELQTNPYIFIPASIIAAAAMARLEKNGESKGKLSKALAAGLNAGINFVLPLGGQVVFAATKAGALAYNKYVEDVFKDKEMSVQDRLRAIGAAVPLATGAGLGVSLWPLSPQTSLEAVAPGMTELMSSWIGANPASLTAFAYKAAVEALLYGIYLGPVIETIQSTLDITSKKSLFERIEAGFIKGIESSFFGLLSRGDAPQPAPSEILEVTAKRWKATLDVYPGASTMSKQEQKKLYDDCIERLKAHALERGVDAKDILPRPSFEVVDAYLDTKAKEAEILETTAKRWKEIRDRIGVSTLSKREQSRVYNIEIRKRGNEEVIEEVSNPLTEAITVKYPSFEAVESYLAQQAAAEKVAAEKEAAAKAALDKAEKEKIGTKKMQKITQEASEITKGVAEIIWGKDAEHTKPGDYAKLREFLTKELKDIVVQEKGNMKMGRTIKSIASHRKEIIGSSKHTGVCEKIYGATAMSIMGGGLKAELLQDKAFESSVKKVIMQAAEIDVPNPQVGRT
jgi:hypothetical protein